MILECGRCEFRKEYSAYIPQDGRYTVYGDMESHKGSTKHSVFKVIL